MFCCVVQAVEEREVNALEAALRAADAMRPPYSDAEVEEARALVNQLHEEAKVLRELKDAVNARDKGAIESLLERCMGLGLDAKDDVKSAHAFLKRLEEEEQCRTQLAHAVEDKNLLEIDAWLAKMARPPCPRKKSKREEPFFSSSPSSPVSCM